MKKRLMDCLRDGDKVYRREVEKFKETRAQKIRELQAWGAKPHTIQEFKDDYDDCDTLLEMMGNNTTMIYRKGA